ncbi:MAG: class I SAM-dependent methyltransferase [Spirochaetaceae bacterium]|jgi:2-polyprenyl-3-methyl-5-hydroxy-6-metoxy-1,4-benzoquinol methylase|nr:class I SAM-dependent methyltransferase [Spirochaetaceae bacterium]
MIKTWSTPVVEEGRREEACELCGGRDFSAHLRCEGFQYVRCNRCSLVQINPQPCEDAVRRRYCGEDYLEYELANEEAFLTLGLLALRDAGFYQFERGLGGAERRVLDVGCATGALLSKLRERGWRAEGVEINRKQADYARRVRGLPVYGCPLEDAALPAGAYLLITASHLIEHLRRPRAFLAEARRLLAPGGRLFLTTPNIDGFQARLFAGRWRSAIFDHLYLFSVKTLTRLLAEEGFRVERSVTWGGLAAGLAPRPVKAALDGLAKRFGFGDVMLLSCLLPARETPLAEPRSKR